MGRLHVVFDADLRSISPKCWLKFEDQPLYSDFSDYSLLYAEFSDSCRWYGHRQFSHVADFRFCYRTHDGRFSSQETRWLLLHHMLHGITCSCLTEGDIKPMWSVKDNS
ncbi:hypothetical protein J6590_087420 [Homalodisca vitripennis]|nr:hypothetical protein J6590_087420 [Homalodisca vitripennis]